MKVFVVGGAYGYGALFIKFGHEIVLEMEEADLICFTGGEDVHPSFYNEELHPRTYSNKVRDEREKKMFNLAMTLEKPMVGICRGGQFLNVLSGGKMYQDISNHCIDHDLKDVETGQIYYVSSTHHQMMRPGPGATIVGIANNHGYKEYMQDAYAMREYDGDDIEIVFYPLTKCLCFQPHPEFNGPEYEEMQQYFFSLISKHLKVN